MVECGGAVGVWRGQGGQAAKEMRSRTGVALLKISLCNGQRKSRKGTVTVTRWLGRSEKGEKDYFCSLDPRRAMR